MYIKLPCPDKKCSKCGAINQTESVRRGDGLGKTLIITRCTVCGHEKVEAEESIYPATGETIYQRYNVEKKEVEEF